MVGAAVVTGAVVTGAAVVAGTVVVAGAAVAGVADVACAGAGAEVVACAAPVAGAVLAVGAPVVPLLSPAVTPTGETLGWMVVEGVSAEDSTRPATSVAASAVVLGVEAPQDVLAIAARASPTEIFMYDGNTLLLMARVNRGPLKPRSR